LQKTKNPTIGNYANVEVGITTGANDYFTVPLPVVEAYDLKEYAKPMVGRSVQVNSVIFHKRIGNLNSKPKRKPTYWYFQQKRKLTDTKERTHTCRLGESMGVNKGYKTGIRDDWFVIPSIKLSDALFIRRNNLLSTFNSERSKRIYNRHNAPCIYERKTRTKTHS
jgi:adenine-specific DNA-methyltransferase